MRKSDLEREWQLAEFSGVASFTDLHRSVHVPAHSLPKIIKRTAYELRALFRLVQLSALVRESIAELLYPRNQEPPDPQIVLTPRAA